MALNALVDQFLPESEKVYRTERVKFHKFPVALSKKPILCMVHKAPPRHLFPNHSSKALLPSIIAVCVTDCATAIFCAAITAPANATLSSDAVTVGVIVLVQCQPGTAFPDGNLTKFLQCVDISSAVSWNDTLDDCQGRLLFVVIHFYSFVDDHAVNCIHS